MKIRNILSAAIIAATCGFSMSAQAADAYLTQAHNLRAGPGKNYPIIAALPGSTGVAVRGCTDGWKWCDVSYRGAQGWVVGSGLAGSVGKNRLVYRNNGQRFGVPVVVFDQRNYWDQHYKDRPWYNDKQYWHGAQPMPTHPVVGRLPAQVDHNHDGIPDSREGVPAEAPHDYHKDYRDNNGAHGNDYPDDRAHDYRHYNN